MLITLAVVALVSFVIMLWAGYEGFVKSNKLKSSALIVTSFSLILVENSVKFFFAKEHYTNVDTFVIISAVFLVAFWGYDLRQELKKRENPPGNP